MLFIVDEAQTGLGRSGDLFGINHEGVVPDILTRSKTLRNGLPLSAVVTSNEIATTTQDQGCLFYITHVNDPLPASVGHKVLDIVLRDHLASRPQIAGAKLHAGLKHLQSRCGCIGDVRGRELMAGVEIVRSNETKEADVGLGKRLSARMFELGLSATISARTYFSGCIRIAPPIIIADGEIEEGLRVMEEAFAGTEGSMPLY